jgi:hypothetical protein
MICRLASSFVNLLQHRLIGESIPNPFRSLVSSGVIDLLPFVEQTHESGFRVPHIACANRLQTLVSSFLHEATIDSRMCRLNARDHCRGFRQ